MLPVWLFQRAQLYALRKTRRWTTATFQHIRRRVTLSQTTTYNAYIQSASTRRVLLLTTITALLPSSLSGPTPSDVTIRFALPQPCANDVPTVAFLRPSSVSFPPSLAGLLHPTYRL